MVLEMSIVLRETGFKDSKEKCPRCGHINLFNTANYGWIECQKCSGQFQTVNSEIGTEKCQLSPLGTRNEERGDRHRDGDIFPPALQNSRIANSISKADDGPQDNDVKLFFRRIHVIYTNRDLLDMSYSRSLLGAPATFPFCTKDTLIDRPILSHSSLKNDIRPAVKSDIESVADLCYDFATVSLKPFGQSREESYKEATLLVHNNEVWVHRVQRGDEPSELASIVCFTNQGAFVAAISKVYTATKWTKKGCAERIVRRVCKHLLRSKERVVLSSVVSSKAAEKVYRRVGFVGFEGESQWFGVGPGKDTVQLVQFSYEKQCADDL